MFQEGWWGGKECELMKADGITAGIWLINKQL